MASIVKAGTRRRALSRRKYPQHVRRWWRRGLILLTAGSASIALIVAVYPDGRLAGRLWRLAEWSRPVGPDAAYADGWEVGGGVSGGLTTSEPDPLSADAEQKLADLSDLRQAIGAAYEPTVDWQRPALPASVPWYSIPPRPDAEDAQ